jgi:hypothetical protein
VVKLVRREDGEGSSAEQSGGLQQAKDDTVDGWVRNEHVADKERKMWNEGERRQDFDSRERIGCESSSAEAPLKSL